MSTMTMPTRIVERNPRDLCEFHLPSGQCQNDASIKIGRFGYCALHAGAAANAHGVTGTSVRRADKQRALTNGQEGLPKMSEQLYALECIKLVEMFAAGEMRTTALLSKARGLVRRKGK